MPITDQTACSRIGQITYQNLAETSSKATVLGHRVDWQTWSPLRFALRSNIAQTSVWQQSETHSNSTHHGVGTVPLIWHSAELSPSFRFRIMRGGQRNGFCVTQFHGAGSGIDSDPQTSNGAEQKVDGDFLSTSTPAWIGLKIQTSR